MWTIAKLTIIEIFYKRIFLVILLMSLAFLVFYGLGIHFLEGKMAPATGNGTNAVLEKGFLSTQFYGMGLYFASFITSLLAIFSSVGSISREIESRQIDPWLSRALARSSFVFGRFVGLNLLLVSYSIFLFLGVTAINQWVGDQLKADVSMFQLAQALGLFILQPVILVAVSLFFSARISTLNSGIMMIMLYVIGMFGGFIEQFGAMTQVKVMVNIGIITSLIFPIDSLFRKMTIYLFDAADNPISLATQGIFGSVSIPSDIMMVYACLYGMIAVWLAIRSFSKRDF
ncbi:ABC transporter permease [Laceyella putida]|uniref:ABC transporter permease n=1 Tax=Laceyella putida TaxID=110101 RepID=A0ABW2RGU5_9BACL